MRVTIMLWLKLNLEAKSDLGNMMRIGPPMPPGETGGRSVIGDVLQSN